MRSDPAPDCPPCPGWQWKAAWAWFVATIGPGFTVEILPALQAGHAPTPENWWKALALAITGGVIVNMKRPGDHKGTG